MERIVIESKLRETVKAKATGDAEGIRVSDEFVEAVNAQVALMVDAALRRCVSNGRKTLRAQDV